MVMALKNKIAQLTNERDSALMKAEGHINSWQEQEKRIRDEIDAQNERMKDLIQQNELLLNQIQELSLKLSVKQSHVIRNFVSFIEKQFLRIGELMRVIYFRMRRTTIEIHPMSRIAVNVVLIICYKSSVT